MTDLSHTAQIIADAFDLDYYLEEYPDIRSAGIDPLKHYTLTGGLEGRKPNPWFDGAYYLALNQDVAAAGINPLYHFLVAGKREGRLPHPPSPIERARIRVSQAAEPHDFRPLSDLLSVDAIRRRLGRDGTLVVGVSHDNHSRSVGGVQLVVTDETAAVLRKGGRYLHLSPAAPGMALAKTAKAFYFVRVNDRDCGIASQSTVKDLIRSESGDISWSIHHLMGHAVQPLADVVMARAEVKKVFWAHDFYASCQNPNLLRNDVTFCGAPPLESSACRACAYGGVRTSHVKAIESFIDRVEPLIVAPSQVALELWSSFTGRDDRRGLVLPIAEVVQTRRAVARKALGRLKVGFLGARVFHKGWHVFEEIARHFSGDDRYQFIQLGNDTGAPRPKLIEHVEVSVTSKDRFAMIDAIARHDVRAVVNWSIWPETFNLALHEGIAAGAAMIVRAGVGNVWRAALRLAPERTLVAADLDELRKLFQSGLVAHIAASPVRLGGMVPSAGATEILLSSEASQ